MGTEATLSRHALRWAFAQDGPSVIEAFVDASEYLQTVYD